MVILRVRNVLWIIIIFLRALLFSPIFSVTRAEAPRCAGDRGGVTVFRRIGGCCCGFFSFLSGHV